MPKPGDQTPEKKTPDTVQEGELAPQRSLAAQKQAIIDEFKEARIKAKRKVASEMDKLKASKDKTFGWHYENAKDKFLYAMDDKLNRAQNRMEAMASQETSTIEKLAELRDVFQNELNMDTDNIIALFNSMTETEFGMAREGLAELETYIGDIQLMMRSPESKYLRDIFNEVITSQSLTPLQQEILEEGMVNPDQKIATLTATILKIAKGSVREEFTKKFIDKYPLLAVKTLLFGNMQGMYSAFDMQQYYKYAIDTYSKRTEPNYQEGKAKFTERMGKFEEESKGFQENYMIQQEQMKKRAEALGMKEYGNDFGSRFNPTEIGKFAARLVSGTALVGNFLANRPLLAETYKKEGLASAVKAFVTIPYVAASGATLVALNRLDAEEPFWITMKGKTERDAKAYTKGLKDFMHSIDTRPKWGEFLINGGAVALAEYEKQLKNADGTDKEPTVDGFKKFLTEYEKNMSQGSKPSRYLESALTGEFEKDETNNLKIFLGLMKDHNIQTQTQFNEKLDEARRTI